MVVKERSTLVVTISSLVIASVLALTIFGFYAYLEWKEKNIGKNYKLALYDLNGELFGKYIIVKLGAGIDTHGIFKNTPIVSGTIKNTSNKEIFSLQLRVAFHDAEDRVLYVDTFYPIGLESEPLAYLSDITKKTENFLLEGDSISFKHQLKNCPPRVLNYLKSKTNFAKSEEMEPLGIVYKIKGLDIK